MIIVSIQSTFLNTLFYLALTLKQGKVTYIIDQSAYMQSYECVHKVCEHLIYGIELPKGKTYLPIHIYNKYNLE